MSTTTINFTMKDLDGIVVPNTDFIISSGRLNTGEIPDVLPADLEFTTDDDGQATVELEVTEAPYYISKQDGTTDTFISYKFFVPFSATPLNAEMLYVDLGKLSEGWNDKSVAALIEAKVVVVNARNQALQFAQILGDINNIENSLENVAIVKENIENIDTIVDSIPTINTVSASISGVNSVSGSITNVNTVAGSIGNVNAVASNTSNVNTVASSISSVNTVSSNNTNLTTTATNITNVNTVANNVSSVNIVAGIAAAVTNVAENVIDINQVSNDRNLAQDAATAAQAARVAAEAARDTSFTNADVYTSIAAAQDDAGLANGKQYQIVSADGLTMLRYRKDSSIASTPMASYPTASAAMLTSGNIFASTTIATERFNGATSVSASGRVVGFTIPTGQTGANTYLGAEIPSTSMRGKTVRLIQRYEATAGWMAVVFPLTRLQVQSRSSSATTNLTPTSFSRTQVGTEIVQICTVVVPADSNVIRQMVQVDATNAAESSDQTIQITGVAYQVVSGSNATNTIADMTLDQRLQWINPAIAAAIAPVSASVTAQSSRIDQAMLTSGNVLGSATVNQARAQAFNGATITTTNGVEVGFAIASGAGTGVNTYITRYIDARGLIGKQIDLTATYTASSGFVASCPINSNGLQVVISGVTTLIPASGISRTLTQNGSTVTLTARYTVPSGTTDLGIIYQVDATSTTQAFDRSIAISSLSYQLVPASGQTVNNVNADDRISKALAVALDGVTYTTATIPAGATRTYTTPKAANDAVVNATATARTEIQLDPGAYSTDPEGWTLARYATLKGYGASTPVISYTGADGATHANLETLWIRQDGTLENVKITGRNVRYAVHAESGAIASGAVQNAKVSVKDCWIEHFGNANNNWPTQSAWGSGISSGWHVRSENNIYRAPYSAFFYHTNNGFSKPTLVENIGDTFVNTGTDPNGRALEIQPMGSGQKDQHRLINCRIDGMFFANCYLWLHPTIDYQPANHMEIESVGYGNSKCVFQASDFGRALRIRAITEAGSSIAVSGDAVPIIFGTVRTFPGVTNIPAYVDGSFDVSGTPVGLAPVNITSLGKRLGNCTSVNKTLTVTVNGGAPVNVIFNADYTNTDNATIIAAMQAAIGSTGVVVVDTYAPGELYFPRLLDEERSLLNASSTVGIPRRSVLAYDGTNRRVRLMTSADSASLFAGVALEDIYPGQVGRVKTRGWLWLAHIRGSAAAGSLVYGATMSVGTTPGRVDAGGSQGLLRAVRTDAVEVAP